MRYVLTFLVGFILGLIAPMVHADVVTQLTLPTERTDNTPIYCDLSGLDIHLSGNCANYRVIDLDGRKSAYSSPSCGGCSADLNGDGVVNAADTAIMKEQFYKTSLDCN